MPAFKRLVIAPALLTWLAAPATAGDDKPATGSASPSGLYFGAHLGSAWGGSDWSARTAGDTVPQSGSIDLYKPYDVKGGTGSYVLGLQLGSDRVVAPGVVLGMVVDASAPSLVGGMAPLTSPTAGAATYGERVEWSGTVRGRLGVMHGGWLWYGTGGWAWSWDRFERTQLNASLLPGGSQPGDAQTVRDFRSGWVAGGGVEVPLTANWSAAIEYLHAGFGGQTVAFQGGAQRVTGDLGVDTARIAVNYRPGGETFERDSDAAPVTSLDLERWAVHGQTTYVHQYAIPFREPYRGTNSLISGQSRETWDATAYVGFKPWSGGELWVNPEIVQGFGLANTLGVAGFTSGEAYKLGAAYPYARIPRLFLRQTWDLGGQSEDVAAGINQFAMKRTNDRLVVTVGKFSVSDIFDDNKFAHDARTDFLNWALIDTASWDYAADAWGYTYGAAAELTQGDWTFSSGLFAMPKVPNSTLIDTSGRQYQVQGEIEHRHTLWGQPGEINLTGFMTHGRMGRFDDAIRFAMSTGNAADITVVRRFNDRLGFAFNIEQNITTDVGVFVRAGTSDGRLETFAFTDVDRALSGGFSIGGTAWGRPKDQIGIAGIVNQISGVHQAFLNAGGLGILVGDGKLPHPGDERILETYYALPFWGVRLTLDYQLVTNPGYNQDRGPASIIGTRIRTMF